MVSKEMPAVIKPFDNIGFRTALLRDLAEGKQNFFRMHEFFGLAYQGQAYGLPVYANNAAALAGGLSIGALYRTNATPDTVCVVH